MAQFQAFAPGVTVNGQTVLSVVSGMGSFKNTAVKILQQHGIQDLSPLGWYSQQSWLDAFRDIFQGIGVKTLYQIGVSIPKNAKFPPGIDNLEKALASIDAAYHLNHRGGEIGHYQFTKTAPSQGVMVCHNPYPCEFDRGIIEAMATRFRGAGPAPKVVHDSSKPCRSKQGDSCTFLIAW